jgi:hypothetical protein
MDEHDHSYTIPYIILKTCHITHSFQTLSIVLLKRRNILLKYYYILNFFRMQIKERSFLLVGIFSKQFYYSLVMKKNQSLCLGQWPVSGSLVIETWIGLPYLGFNTAESWIKLGVQMSKDRTLSWKLQSCIFQ